MRRVTDGKLLSTNATFDVRQGINYAVSLPIVSGASEGVVGLQYGDKASFSFIADGVLWKDLATVTADAPGYRRLDVIIGHDANGDGIVNEYGRARDRRQLREAFTSDESEFVAVFGRRRVGKTYLVRETLGSFFTFQHTGIKKGGKEIHLERFRVSLKDQGLADCPELKSWFDAFDQLKALLGASGDVRKVVFIDEIP